MATFGKSILEKLRELGEEINASDATIKLSYHDAENNYPIFVIEVVDGIAENIAQQFRDILPSSYIVEFWDSTTIFVGNP